MFLHVVVWLYQFDFEVELSQSLDNSPVEYPRMGLCNLIKHPYVLCGGLCPLSQFQLVPVFTKLSELAVFCSMGVQESGDLT